MWPIRNMANPVGYVDVIIEKLYKTARIGRTLGVLRGLNRMTLLRVPATKVVKT